MRGYNFLAATLLALIVTGCGSTPIPDPEPQGTASQDDQMEGRGSASSGIEEDPFGPGEEFAEDSPDGELAMVVYFDFDESELRSEYSDLLAKPLPPVKNGHRPLLTDPGLGITIDENKLMAQVGEPRPYRPQFDPDDGSVVDW